MSQALLASIFPLLCFALIALAIIAVVVANSIRIMPEYQRLVIFRLGRSRGTHGIQSHGG